MTSEVENVLNGQLVRTEAPDKTIAVSSANLQPDQNGEVLLSKQSVFMMPTQGMAPVLEQTPAAPTPEAEPVLENPIAQATEVAPAAPVAPTPEVPADIAPVAPAEPEVPVPAPAPEAEPEAEPAPMEATPNETLEQTPVENLEEQQVAEAPALTEAPAPEAETVEVTPLVEEAAPAPEVAPTETVVDGLAATPFEAPAEAVPTEAAPAAEVPTETPAPETSEVQAEVTPVETTPEQEEAAPVAEEPETLEPAEKLEDLSPVTPVSDVITEAPLEVADTTALGGFDVNKMVPDINIPEPVAEAPVEEAPAVEMPEMPEVVVEEPTDTNNRLFADHVATPEELAASPIDTSALTETQTEEPTETKAGEAPEEEVVEVAEKVEDEIPAPPAAPKESIFEDDLKNEKLDEIISLLQGIDLSFDELNTKLDEINETLANNAAKAAEIPVMKDGIVEPPIMEAPVAPIVEEPTPVAEAPLPEGISEPAPIEPEALAPLPAEETQAPVEETAAPEAQADEMVGAMEQLPDILDKGVDESQIQGMFI